MYWNAKPDVGWTTCPCGKGISDFECVMKHMTNKIFVNISFIKKIWSGRLKDIFWKEKIYQWGEIK